MIKSHLVVGGFEPSGHDAAEECITSAGLARGLAVNSFRWRDVVNIGSHPMFLAHRRAAAQGAPNVAGLLDGPWIAQALAQDLAARLPTGFDTIISVHPWSSMICAEALRRDGNSATTLVDYSGEFSSFPAVVHPRIDAYFGGGNPRPLEPTLRSKFHNVGVAVPTRFHCDTPSKGRASVLVVAAGSDGWAVRAMSEPARDLVAELKPKETVLLAPNPESAEAWARANLNSARIMSGVEDISDLLKCSRWYLSKAGGTAVAEGLAAGCEGFAAPSGIFWEDEALANLYTRGVIRIVGAAQCKAEGHSDALNRERLRCRAAANLIWDIIGAGELKHTNPVEKVVLSELLDEANAIPDSPLVNTTKALRAHLREWRDGWNG